MPAYRRKLLEVPNGEIARVEFTSVEPMITVSREAAECGRDVVWIDRGGEEASEATFRQPDLKRAAGGCQRLVVSELPCKDQRRSRGRPRIERAVLEKMDKMDKKGE